MACFMKHLEGYRKLIVDSSIKTKCTKILKKACKTRWLSFEASIVAAMEDLIPLVQTLNDLSDSDPAANGLLQKLNSPHFVGLLFILHAILPILGKISRIFQKGYVNFASIRPTLDSAISELRQIETENSPIQTAKNELAKGGRLELLEVEIKDHTEKQLKQTLTNYTKALIENIERRFPDVPLLVAFNIFKPCDMPDDKEDTTFQTYGDDSIEIIHQHFANSDTSLGELKAEWNLLKFHIHQKKTQIPVDINPLEWCLKQIMKNKYEYSYMCPNLTRIVELILTLPVSNAWPERGASKVKIIKTDLRNRLKNDMLNGLLHMAVNGPELCSKKCDQLVMSSVEVWMNEKKRRKIPPKVASISGIYTLCIIHMIVD